MAEDLERYKPAIPSEENGQKNATADAARCFGTVGAGWGAIGERVQVSDWGSGYVTDVPYMPGYYVQQSPVHMVVAARVAGFACDLPDDDDPIYYLELGCGAGLGALALAASNASWRVTGVDFNPAHIATARAFARDAGIRNATFLEADLATLADDRAADAIPEADFVSAHGVWTWVPATVRAGIVRLLRAKVRAGGLVHLSYNVLPGWQSALGMQRVIRAGGLARPGRSDRQAQAGLELLRALHGAGAYHLAGAPFVEKLVKGMPDMPPAYLAHEFMNASWSPCFHADVAAALSEAKLEWIGPANVLENFPDLLLTLAERKIFEGVQDPLTRELIKDVCLARALRHDIFMRGPNRLAGADLVESLREISLTLAVSAADFSFEIEMAKGAAQLSRAFYAPVVAALAEQPQQVGTLMALSTSTEKVARNPAEVIGVLIGTGQALPVLRPGAPLSPAARALNELIVAAFGRLEHRGALLATRVDSFGRRPAGQRNRTVRSSSPGPRGGSPRAKLVGGRTGGAARARGEGPAANAAFARPVPPRNFSRRRSRLARLCRILSSATPAVLQPDEPEPGYKHFPGSRLRNPARNHVGHQLVVKGLAARSECGALVGSDYEIGRLQSEARRAEVDLEVDGSAFAQDRAGDEVLQGEIRCRVDIGGEQREIGQGGIEIGRIGRDVVDLEVGRARFPKLDRSEIDHATRDDAAVVLGADALAGERDVLTAGLVLPVGAAIREAAVTLPVAVPCAVGAKL